MSDSPVGPEDIRAAAETFRELGPDYHDAVIASFIDRIDREVDLRVEARLAELGAVPAPPARRRGRRVLRTSIAAGVAAVAVVAGVAAVAGSHAGPVAHAFRVVPGTGGAEIIISGHVDVRPNGTRIFVPRHAVPAPPQAPPAPAPPN